MMNFFKKRKAKRMFIGAENLTDVSEKLKLLDQVLDLFGMRLGAESFEVTCDSGVYTKVVLSGQHHPTSTQSTTKSGIPVVWRMEELDVVLCTVVV